MNLILLGAPGAGKGTQAFELVKIFNIPQISTGDIFRANIKEGTELGILAQSYISQGQLVPDDVTSSIVFKRLLEEDCKAGFLLDGFPRTVPQAEALDRFLTENHRKIDHVINIVVEDDSIIERLSKRRTCPSCNASYHLDYAAPKKKNTCDKCGMELVQRKDDVPEVIAARLSAYHSQTKPLIEFYGERGVLVSAKSEDKIEDSLRNTMAALGRTP